MGKSNIHLSTYCVLFVLAALWTPALTEDKCTLGCKGTASSPGFLSGHKYNYAIEGTVSVFLSGADKQETSVKLLGQVAVSALGNCALVLKVHNLAISGPDGKKYGKPAGLEKPVRFTLQDGFAGSEVCSEEGDTRRSLNIKRAIISLLQTGQRSSTEVDIFGACPTDSTSSVEGGATIVHRSRDLGRCGHREHGKNDLITAVYNPQAEIKNTQIMHSTLNVESKVNNGIPEKVSAIEEYLYKPFSVRDNGARAGVTTKLTLTNQGSGADTGNFKEVHSIIFENPHGVPEHSNYNSALQAVKETAKNVADNTNVKSAGLFAQIVRIFRLTNKEDLMKIYNQVKGNEVEKRVFLDAVLRTGTGYSIEACIEILKSKSLSPLEQKLVYLSFGNARHVTNQALKAATSLLATPNLPKEIYLGVGALAGAYCRAHNCHDGKNDGIVTLSQKLGAKIHCRPKTKTEEDLVVAVFKGIRNIRHLEDSLIEKIAHCAADNQAKSRLRVAAFEAFHADPCAAKLKKTALDTLKNRQLDSEIRIRAYLAVIDCPCGKSANEIKTLLETEPVHQVGHFITTSLRHIRASANPDKKLARQHYGLIRTPNKFNVDDRKYSFYREGSYSIDTFGIGSTVEQTVIYSQDSFLPRSASLNLTAEIFGHNVNVLEVGGRQGNLDRVLEHFFGPKGVVRTENPQELFDNLVKRFKETEKKFEGKLRGRRSIKSDVDNLDKHVKSEAQPYNDELDLDIYVKLFGTDAVFLSLGDGHGFNFNKVLDEILRAAESGINQAKHFQQELRSHLLFLDAELAYATSTGLPLKLQLTGSATGRLEISSNIDIRQIIRDPNNAKVDIKLVPSSNIEIAGVFLVDADVVATGLKVVTNLHSSTGGHIVAKVLENGQGFDLQLGLPIEKQEIVTATNDLVFFTAEKGQMEKNTAIKTDVDKKEYAACFDQLSGVIGLTLCGEISVPFSVSGPEAQASIQKFLARYPLTGSSRVKLHFEKNDLRGYHLKGVFKTNNPEKKSFELLLEAEGKQNRKTSLTGDFVNSAEEKSLSVSLESPIKILHGQVSLLMKPNEYVALVKAKMDLEEYFARAGFNVQGNDQRSIFKPVAEYQLPGAEGKKSLKVDGQIIREKSGPDTKYTFQDIKINLPNNEVVDINGHIGIGRTQEVDIKAKKGEHNALVTYSQKGYEGKLEFQNTLNPFINFKATVFSQNEKGNVHNDIDLFYGGDLNNQQNRVTINQMLKYHKNTPEDFGLITKNKFAIYALPLIASFNADADPKKVDFKVEGKYLDKEGEMKLEARTGTKKPGDYSVKFGASLDKKGVEAYSKRDIVSPEKSNLENYIIIKNVGKYELSGVVIHKTKPNDINVGAIGHLKISGGKKNEEIKFDIGVIENAKLYASHAKITQSKTEIIDFMAKINHGNNPSGQLKLNLKDTITANGQFKVTDNDGKGNGMIIVDFKKAQHKIKADVKFVSKAPVFNAEVDVFLNFEKDNTDKFHFNTVNKHNEKLIESKNKFNYGGKKFEVNAMREGEIGVEGKCKANIEVVLPNERYFHFKVNRDISIKDGIMNGESEFTLLDAEKRGGPASSVSYQHKVKDTHLENMDVEYEGLLILKINEGQEYKHSYHLKDKPQGDLRKFEFKGDLSGTGLRPAALSMNVDYTDPDKSLIDGTEKYHIKGNYGDDVVLEISGNADVQLLHEGDKKMKEDMTFHVILPFEKAHDIKVVTDYEYIIPENKANGIQGSVSNMVQVNADVYKLDTSAKFGAKDGFYKLNIVVPHEDPVSLELDYKADLESDSRFAKIDVKSAYGKGKSADIGINVKSANHVYDLVLKGHAPQAEKLKKLELNVQAKKPSADAYNNVLTLDLDGKVYKSDMTVVYSKAQPVFDVSYTCPHTGKTSRFFIKGHALSSNQGKLELKIDNIRDFSLTATSEGVVNKDNVVFKLQADSEKLGLKHYLVDISSKDAGSGKRLEFHVTNNNKNILGGSTSFISKQEGQKTIIEGSGSVKVKEEQKSATFKYIRTMLTEGAEQGVETFVNVAIGDRSYVGEARVTNLEYKTSLVYCEEKKQCAHAELHSKINVQKPGVAQHTVNMGLDLRKLGFAPEFGLQMNHEVGEQRLPQYNLDIYMNKDTHKYHFHVYSTPQHGKFPAGVTITLPTRVVAAEALLQYPVDRSVPFPMKADAAVYLDKKNPATKTAVRALLDVTGDNSQHGLAAEFGFTHPKLGKEAVFKVNGKLQRPSENSVKIESLASFSHPTLGKDREAKIIFEASPVHIKALVDTPIVQVIDLEGSNTVTDNLQQTDLKFSLLHGKAVQVRALAKEYKYFEFSTGYSDEAERRLSVVAHLDPEKRVDISADIILPNEKKNIIHGAMFLQDNIVKSDYGVSNDHFNYFVNALKNDMKNLESRIKQLGEKTSAEVKADMQRIEPTLKKLDQAYRDELEKFFNEISNDQTLKEISQTMYDVVAFVSKIVKELMDATKPICDKVQKILTETVNKIEDLYTKQVEPQLKQLYQNVSELFHHYLDGVIDIVAHYAAILIDFIEKHKPELQELTNTFTEIFKDLSRLVVAQLKEIRAAVGQVLSDFFQQLKDLPIANMIKEKFQDLAVPEQGLALLNEAHQTIRMMLPTEETKSFADAFMNYVEKKLRNEKVDDSQMLRVIYEKFAAALTSTIQFVRQQLNQHGVPTALTFNPLTYLTSPTTSLPSLGGPPSFSLVNQLLHGDLPDPLALIRAYRLRSLNPLDEFPPKLRAVVVNGQHLFTFDGRHLTFPGTCRYVLTHDYVDRNFTLVLQLQNGAPKALILEDKNGVTVELRENGQVAVNGAVHGFPVVEKASFAFRTPNKVIGVGTNYGLMAFCTSKLEVCYIDVNGFYSGKLRGLLGDGNNEEYDDFRLPSGKIVSSEAEFGNSYKLSSGCAAAATPAHHQHQHHGPMPAACEQVFGATSTLRPLALFLDVAPFRQACVHAVSSAAPESALQEACDLGRGYVALAVTGLLPAVLPPVCVRCTDADKPRKLGESYEYKLPAKQADVVVAVELTKSNEKTYKEVIVPLVGQVVDALKNKHVDDIKVYLVGITTKMPYVYLYDTDNKLKGAKIKFDEESRYTHVEPIEVGVMNIDQYTTLVAGVVDQIRYAFGLTNVVAGYNQLLELPLRPGAVKHILSVVGEACAPAPFFVDAIRGLSYGTVFKNNAITTSVVTLTPDLQVDGHEPAHVIGFDDDTVLFVDDKKKGDKNTRQSLKYKPNGCISFVESTEGMVLSSSNFVSLTAPQQKQFLKAASSNIVERMLSTHLEQHCICAYGDPFSARSVCVADKTANRRRK